MTKSVQLKDRDVTIADRNFFCKLVTIAMNRNHVFIMSILMIQDLFFGQLLHHMVHYIIGYRTHEKGSSCTGDVLIIDAFAISKYLSNLFYLVLKTMTISNGISKHLTMLQSPFYEQFIMSLNHSQCEQTLLQTHIMNIQQKVIGTQSLLDIVKIKSSSQHARWITCYASNTRSRDSIIYII